MGMTGEDIAIKLGFDSTAAAGYIEHVQSVKRDFLRRDHPDLLEGPKAIKDNTGSLLIWEQGLEDFYKIYNEMWSLTRFGNSAVTRRNFAHNFLVAQAKKARQDQTEERKKAEAAAKRKAERERQLAQTGVHAMKTRGRKRYRMEPPTSRNLASPPSHKSSPHRRSVTSSHNSLPPSPKRRKILEKPELKFSDFVLILKGLSNPPATSYDARWRFEDLLAWILEKIPSLQGQKFLCWIEVTIRQEEYAEMLGCALGAKCNRMITDQSSWNAAVMAAQANRLSDGQFYGIGIFARLEIDLTAPEHCAEDVISLQNEDPETGEDIEELEIADDFGDVEIAEGKGCDEPDQQGTGGDGEVGNDGEEDPLGCKKSIICS